MQKIRSSLVIAAALLIVAMSSAQANLVVLPAQSGIVTASNAQVTPNSVEISPSLSYVEAKDLAKWLSEQLHVTYDVDVVGGKLRLVRMMD